MTVNYTTEKIKNGFGQTDAMIVQWANMANGDVGQAFNEFPFWSDRSVQVAGTFGAGGNCRIVGSNDRTNFATLTDPPGNDLDFTSAKIENVAEATLEIKPSITGGDGTTSLTVTLLLTRKAA